MACELLEYQNAESLLKIASSALAPRIGFIQISHGLVVPTELIATEHAQYPSQYSYTDIQGGGLAAEPSHSCKFALLTSRYLNNNCLSRVIAC